jgi:hypothetical protein
MDVKLELEKAFNKIFYDDVKHAYWQDNLVFQSVTQFIGSLKPPFEERYWAVREAFKQNGYVVNYYKKLFKVISHEGEFVVDPYSDLSEFNLTPSVEDIIAKWDSIATEGTTRGSFLHNFLEQLDNRDYTKVNESYDDSSQILLELALDFKQKSIDTLYPIAQEYTVGDLDLKIAGKFDRLYYNKQFNEYQIWDFKTDKKLEYSNKYGKIKIFNFDDCEYEKYSLQTSMYKYIIKKNTPIVLGDSYIVHFQYKNSKYDIIKCKDYTNLIKEKLENGNS